MSDMRTTHKAELERLNVDVNNLADMLVEKEMENEQLSGAGWWTYAIERRAKPIDKRDVATASATRWEWCGGIAEARDRRTSQIDLQLIILEDVDNKKCTRSEWVEPTAQRV